MDIKRLGAVQMHARDCKEPRAPVEFEDNARLIQLAAKRAVRISAISASAVWRLFLTPTSLLVLSFLSVRYWENLGVLSPSSSRLTLERSSPISRIFVRSLFLLER